MQSNQRYRDWPENTKTYLALGVGIGAVAVAYALATGTRQNRVASRPLDDAPARTNTSKPGHDKTLVGRTITINRPRAELFAFWADFSNLSRFMQNLDGISLDGDVARWQFAGPVGQTINMATRMTANVENEVLSWASTEDSGMKAEGKVTFRDAPAGRGTELEAVLSYVPPLGEVGRLIGKLFQTDPLIQGRRDLRRLKMLMETGEIATNLNHKTAE